MHSFSPEWIEVLDKITTFTKKSRKVWYRGQNNNSADNGYEYKLISGLFRLPFPVNKILEWELLSYTRFMENGFDIHKTENEWDLLYIMQQFGLKTRLLDWSESFAVALFFATRRWKQHNSCSIWMLDPYRLNELLNGKAELCSISRKSSYLDRRAGFSKSLALSPYVNTTRGLSQKGYFTLQGNTKHGLEEEENNILRKEGVLHQIKLSPNLVDDVKMFLELSGINHFTLFPDLSGLATFVNKWATEEIQKS